MSDMFKAIAGGTIFGGLVDCYVLADKTRVISKRGVSRALSGGSDAPEIKDLPRALGKLPSKYGQIATPRAIEFSRPTGGVAHGISAEQFYDILVAYSEAADLGEITHPGQLRIAANCNRLVRACGKIGIVALVDEATGYQSQRAPDELHTLVDKYLRETPGEWKRLWDKDVVSKLCGLYGIEQRGESFPTFACTVVGKLYRIILPGEVYDEMRSRNGSGEERKGKLHQFFKEALWRFVNNDIPSIAYFARISRTRREFWGHVHARYGGQAFQLDMDLDGESAQ